METTWLVLMALIVLVAEIYYVFATGWVGGFSPTQYGSSVSHSYHHHSPICTIAGINGASGNDEIPTGWGSATEIGLYYTEIANNSLLFFARDNIS